MTEPGEEQHRNAIRRLLSLYCDAVARRDADAAELLFVEDARVRIAGGPIRQGRAAAVAGLRRTLEDFSFLHQQCDTGLIDISGNEARGRIAVMEVNQRAGASDLAMIFGVYEDLYRLTSVGWRFAERNFTFRFRAMVPASESGGIQAFFPAFDFTP